jgi:RHS repeat-associated protein
VYMKGSSPYYAYWPTPGGGTVEVNGNNVTAYYMHKDWLGNSRISSVIVNPAVVSDQAYAPYGEVYNQQATGASTPGQMFTGDTEDITGGIYDTPNRELNASQGRWLSPDPAGQGWNQYAYSTNPNGNVDPSGLSATMAMMNGSGWDWSTIIASDSYGSTNDFGPQAFGTVDADTGSSDSSLAGLNMNFSTGAAMLAGLAATGNAGATPGGLPDFSNVPVYQVPWTIEQIGYVAPGNTLDSSNPSDPVSPYTSIKYQVFNVLGSPMSDVTIGEYLQQLGGNVRPSEPQQWNTDSGGYAFDNLGFYHVSNGAYNVTSQQFYALQGDTPFGPGVQYPLTPTYTQSASYLNGILTTQATPNPGGGSHSPNP